MSFDQLSDENCSTQPPSKLQKKSKVRRYDYNYLNFGFVTAPHDSSRPMCILCDATFSNEAMKPSRLKDHLKRKHPNKIGSDFKKLLKEKEKQKQKQPKISQCFDNTDLRNDRGLIASYNISMMIAKTAKPHTIGEDLVLPAAKEIIESVMQRNASSVLSSVSLSNDTVQRRIDEMSSDVLQQLVGILSVTKHSLQIDESTLNDNVSLLLGYVRFVHNSQPKEEMIFAISLPTDTRASSIFNAVKNFYEEKGIPMRNILQCATDGAPAMVGKHRGFIALMKEEIPGLIAIHCVIHRQHLVSRNLSPELNDSLNIVIKCVNKIKAHALHDRLFRALCCQNDEDFERLLLHTAVRWLSKGACLNRFYALYNSVIELLSNIDDQLASAVTPLKNDIAYLADIFNAMNDVNKKLQGEMITLVRCKSVITSFISKLSLYRQNLSRNILSQFPNLNENVVTEEDRQKYCSHLDTLLIDMNTRFADLIGLQVPDWVIKPFSAEPADIEIELQEELIDLQHDDESKAHFTNDRYDLFWCKVAGKYELLWNEARMWILSFPTSYLVEKGFSAVTLMLSTQRNRLAIDKRGDLRLYLTKMFPDISKLCKDHQVHPSH